MSTVKSGQQKHAVENRVMETMTQSFPDYPMSLTDLRHPTKEFVVPFFTFILEELRINVFKITQHPLEKQIEGCSHPILVNETMQLVNLSQVLKRITTQVQKKGSLQFGLDDLVEPSPSRNTVFMFALLNFYTFADQRLGVLHEKLDVISDRKSQLSDLLDQREKLAREINSRAVKKGKRNDFLKEIKVKKSEMDELSKESKSLDELFEKKQVELEDVKRRISRVQSEISELEKAIHQLESSQVQSPDVLKNNYGHLKQKLEETKQLLQQKQEVSKDKKETIHLLESLVKDQDISQAILNECVHEAKNMKEIEKQLSDMHVKLQFDVKEIEALQCQLKKLKEEKIELGAQMTNLQLQWDKTKKSLMESIRHLTEEKNKLTDAQNSETEETYNAIEKEKMDLEDGYLLFEKLNKRYEEEYAKLNQREHDFTMRELALITEIKTRIEEYDEEENKR